jgi:hypothetical protein
MKLTKSKLYQLIREELEIHLAPENLDELDPEEAYGLGYQACKDMQEEEKELTQFNEQGMPRFTCHYLVTKKGKRDKIFDVKGNLDKWKKSIKGKQTLSRIKKLKNNGWKSKLMNPNGTCDSDASAGPAKPGDEYGAAPMQEKKRKRKKKLTKA